MTDETPAPIQQENLGGSHSDVGQVPPWVENRRNQVLMLLSKGLTQAEISRKLGISRSTISRDVAWIEANIYSSRQTYGEILFKKNAETMAAYSLLIRQLWDIVDNPETTRRECLHAIQLLGNLYWDRMENFANAHIVKRYEADIDAILDREKRVSQREQELSNRETNLEYRTLEFERVRQQQQHSEVSKQPEPVIAEEQPKVIEPEAPTTSESSPAEQPKSSKLLWADIGKNEAKPVWNDRRGGFVYR